MRFTKVLGLLLAAAGVFASQDARTAGPAAPRQVTPNSGAHGFASVYGDVSPDQAEFLSTSDAIRSAAASGAPTLVWEVLEHGEKVECLDCIAAVSPLIYDSNAKTREIAAWWLRRRILGVFGPGQVYEQTIDTLNNTQGDPVMRSYAANAIGEFFAAPGVTACANVLMNTNDDARVRAACASALGRLNSDGAGALAVGFMAADKTVKLASLASAVRVNTFSGVAALTSLTADGDADVRRRAVEALDGLRVVDAVAAVAALVQTDHDAGVRAEACHALGNFGDASTRTVLQNAAQTDTDAFVRDQAQIALRRL